MDWHPERVLVNTAELIIARKKAEEAIRDMPDTPLRMKAFEVILASLLSQPKSPMLGTGLEAQESSRPASSLSSRVGVLVEEGFLDEPRSLSEIQRKLAEHGWHYPQSNLSTPLIRMVRQRELRRLQASSGGKKVWKYSLP